MSKKLRTRKHRVVLNRSYGGDIGIGFFLLLMGLFLFLPMYYTVVQSLKPLDELWMFPPRFYVSSPTFKNFSDLFNLMNTSWVPFSRYIFNTVFISVTGTFGNLLLSSMCAYALAKIKFPGGKSIFAIIVASLMFHSTVSAIANFITLSTLGWIDTYFARIIPAWCTSLGLYLMKQFMETNVNNSVLESARIDGATEWRTFWVIAMPMVKPAWLTLVCYSFKDLWNSGASIYIQSEQLKTFNYAVSQLVSDGISRQGASAAATVISMLVPILVFVISQSNIIETMGSSGMKD
ncbi:MAG: carbohydrate ABC transporter permease [Ruminococcaceae bacterium]|nr:carbohydrate ABC transporter permease [Oscillospiraceae bacterium]